VLSCSGSIDLGLLQSSGSTLKMEAVCFCIMFVLMYHATQHHIPEDHNCNTHLCIFVYQESYNQTGLEKTFSWVLKCVRSAARKEYTQISSAYEIGS
jgi:hypothetical protein